MNTSFSQEPHFLKHSIQRFSKRPRLEKILISAALFLALAVSVLVIEKLSDRFGTTIPVRGGSFHEGVVGFPGEIHPAYAKTNVDHDLVALIFSGLVKINHLGEIVPDLAQSYELSEDGLTYSFVLKEGVVFHDAVPITAEDVLFTFERIQSPASESPLHGIFRDVLVDAEEDGTITFTLPTPHAGFLEQLTVGIVPKHLWEGVTKESLSYVELVNHPIGSGPYKVIPEKIKRNELGVPVYYPLEAHTQYKEEPPFIQFVVFHFFRTEEELVRALKSGAVQSASALSPSSLEKLNLSRFTLHHPEMLRVFGIFFNTEKTPLDDEAVREAIDRAIDREFLAETVFSGYARPTRIPFPLHKTPHSEETSSPQDILEEAGWELQEGGIREKNGDKLSFTLKTGESGDLRNTAEFIQQTLRPLGFEVTIEFFDTATLNQVVIRERDYEALLFGQAYSSFIDPYPFWHSSQRSDPGLNITGLNSEEVDAELEELRLLSDPEERYDALSVLAEHIQSEHHASFLYSPHLIYITHAKIKNVRLGAIERPSDRFSESEEWFIYTNTVWNIFLKHK